MAVGISLFCFSNAQGCTGDLNGDDEINQQDLGILLANFGTGDGGDLDGDGDTDQSDLGILLSVYNTPCSEWYVMASVPAGEFAMGDHHLYGFNDEYPVHDVFINAFDIGIYEVTNGQYAEYLNSAMAAGTIEVNGSGVVTLVGRNESLCVTTDRTSTSRITWDGSIFSVVADKENHPMIVVGWYGAVTFCNWLSEEQGRQPCYDLDTWTCNFNADGYRLPTEAEWEYAARGGEYTPYYYWPWGDEYDGSMANYWGSGDPYEDEGYPYTYTTPVGYYDGNQVPAGVDMANGYGLYDMAGNVEDWCNDWYDENYYSVSPYDNPTGPETGTKRVLRGGSWNYGVPDMRCSRRWSNTPEINIETIGFRVVRPGE